MSLNDLLAMAIGWQIPGCADINKSRFVRVDEMSKQKYASWNPWHGCTKYSEGCRYCYVYRQDETYGSTVSSEQCRKTLNFNLPIKTKRDGTPKIAPGTIVMTCCTSDFLLKDADEWRDEC